MKTKLQAWKLDTVASGRNSHCWSQALTEIALSRNRQPHSSLGGHSPYEIMFNRKPQWEESIPIHSRLQQTLNNISEEEPNLESHIPHTRSDDQEPQALDLETLPGSMDGRIGIPFSFDDSDHSGMYEGHLSPNLELEVEEQVLIIPEVPHSQTATENMVVRTVLEEAMQTEAAKARARSAHKYNKQHTIECFSAGDLVSLKIPTEDWAATDPPRIFSRIMAESYPNRYKLQAAHGLLKNHYPVNALVRVPEAAGINIPIPTTIMSTEMTLHAAAALISTSDRIGISLKDVGAFGTRFNAPYIATHRSLTVPTSPLSQLEQN
ncbi:unnamed protein product [Tuber aestivum]|uniref:Integrase catalytic domain-containing protein n=1 Tax=Tuber aestivum TaxID=59557 RepID=A0A292Q1C5_9PEZI|nr:unnamed protein product [Tuber aestivum]